MKEMSGVVQVGKKSIKNYPKIYFYVFQSQDFLIAVGREFSFIHHIFLSFAHVKWNVYKIVKLVSFLLSL